MVLGAFKEDKNGNIRLASRLYVDVLGREVFTLWDGDPKVVGSELRAKMQAFRLDAIESLALLGFLRAREQRLKDAVISERLERESGGY